MRVYAIGGSSPLNACLGLIKAGAGIAAMCVRVIAWGIRLVLPTVVVARLRWPFVNFDRYTEALQNESQEVILSLFSIKNQ